MSDDLKKLAEEMAKDLHDVRKSNEEWEAKAEKSNGDLSAQHKEYREKTDARQLALEEQLESQKKSSDAILKKAEEISSALSRPGFAGQMEESKAADYRAAVKDRLLNGKSFDPADFGAKEVKEKGKRAAFQIDIKLMSTDSFPDGGWSTQPDRSGRRVRTEFETSPIEQYATVSPCNSSILTGDYDDGEAEVVKRGEREPMPTTDTPQAGTWAIGLDGYTASPDLTRWLEQDSDEDIVGLLQSKVNRDIQRAINLDSLFGTGKKELRGILTYAAGTNRGEIEQQNTATTLKIVLDDVLKLKALTKEQYDDASTFFMTKQTGMLLRRLKDTQGQYLWQPSLIAGTPAMLDTTPVAYFQDMARPDASDDYVQNQLPIIYGDMARAYQIADRGIFDVIIDEITTPGQIIYHFIRRMGGDVVNFEAIKLLNIV